MSGEKNLFRETMAGCRKALVHVGLFSLAINLLMLVPSLYMLQLYDRVLQTRSYDTLLYLTVIAMAALAVLGLIDSLRARMLVRVSTWIDRRLAGHTFERSIVAGLRGSPYQSRALQDVLELRTAMGSPTLVSLFDAPWVPLYLVVIWLLHPLMALVAAIGAVVLFALALLNEWLTRPPLAAAGESATRNLRLAQTTARNAEAVEAMGMARSVVARWLKDNDETLRLQEQAADRGGVILAFTKFWRLGLQMVIMATGAWLVLQHELTGGGMMAGSILMGRALAPVEGAIGNWKVMVNARGAWRRLNEFLALPEPHPSRMSLPAPTGQVSVSNVWYAYPQQQDRPILRGVSFEIAAGEVLAIVGPSAAGKSTLARILIGLYEASRGTVRLDGARLQTWDNAELGRWLGYLPQDVELFGGTVKENIARMTDAPAEAVIEAAQLADVHDMILQLPQGYDTDIGEAGRLLSGGQRQRLGLARALFGRPRLVVLDEPNSNLDLEGEAALNRSIAEIKAQGTTVVLIAHRPSMLQQVDKVLLMRQGAVEAFGKRDEILKHITRPTGVPKVQPAQQRPQVERRPAAAGAAE
ncbi:MAG TPA: type I secretion system permease/ATPase [Geminicoccaceae bacterium]|nr:type I secretion system permease/ATPase [Geminicoccus sp.]HMU51909.1 type I secretion system permease/ATPase [Geminicoccaceae bacterium]